MNRDLQQGILTAAVYYGVGTCLSLITYVVFGGGSAHVPGLYSFVVLIMLFFGAIWLFSNLIQIIVNPKNRFHQGNLIIHAIIILIGIALLGYAYYSYQ